jgi:hypothetical protein
MSEEKPVKPGYKTTEFWLSTAAVVLGVVVASGIVPSGGAWDQAVGLIVAALAALGYTGSRVSLKKEA